jgi:hypothetical protein
VAAGARNARAGKGRAEYRIRHLKDRIAEVERFRKYAEDVQRVISLSQKKQILEIDL